MLLAACLGLGLRDGASAALACDDGRPGGCSAPGQALAHGYRADPDRQAAHRWPAGCLRPQRGPFESARLWAQGSPGSRCPKLPQVLSGGFHQVRAGPCRSLCRSLLSWDVLGLRSCAPFTPFAGRWRAAVNAQKNELRLFRSIVCSATLTRSEEAFFVALRLSTGALGGASESLASS